MAEGEAESTETPEDAPKPKGSPLPMALGVLNLAATGFLVFRTMTAPVPHVVVSGESGGHHDSGEPAAKLNGPLLTLEPMVVNLSDEGGTRYLKVSFDVEVEDAKAKAEFEKGMVVVRSEMTGYLSGLAVADTLGEENRQKIAATLVERINKMLGKEKAIRVLFKDFVIQ